MAEPTHILGISAFFHDAAAALVRDGEVIAAAQEERFSRIKGDPDFPTQAIRSCLESGGIDLDQVDYVVYYEKPWIRFERLLETYLAHAPRGLRSYLKAMPAWLGQKFFMRRTIGEALSWPGPVLFAEHHESHMAASFYASPFDRAAALTVDGVGEWVTTAWGQGEGNQLRLRQELHFPHSLGLVYSALTSYLGFRVNTGEYKVMGLAPYGEPTYVDAILSHVVDLRPDGSFRLDLSHFDYPVALRMTNERLHRLFGGPPREPDGELVQRHMDIACSLQVVTEEILLRMVRHVHRETGMKNLVMGGGVALNCVANGRILREGPFDDIWIQPAAGDAGGAIGCALAAWHRYLDQPREPPREPPAPLAAEGEGGDVPDRQQGSYLGPEYDQAAVRQELDRLGARYRLLDPDEVPERAAEIIADGRVVGLFCGRMELGPRALGARSILADARRPEMQHHLNEKIKLRESFRPFAPAALLHRAPDYFELDRPSPYMQVVAPVRASRCRPIPPEEEGRGLDRLQILRSEIPAVTHVNCSARVQTVDGRHNRRFYDILTAFEAQTGAGLVLNTSFNVAGEPIVCSPADALRCFLRSGMDALFLEDFLLLKPDQPPHLLAEAGDHRAYEPPKKPRALAAGTLRRQPRRWRSFGLMLACLAAVAALWGIWRTGRAGYRLDPWRAALLVSAGLVGLTGLVAPRALKWPYAAWMGLARLLSRIFAPLVLTIAYLVIIVPVGLVRRLFGAAPLGRPPDRTIDGTYWLNRPPQKRGPDRYTQQF